MIVKNFISVHGHSIANQFIIKDGLTYTAFQSYNTLIAVYLHDVETMYIDKKKYSATTSKYLNRFKEEYSPLHIQYVANSELHKIIESI